MSNTMFNSPGLYNSIFSDENLVNKKLNKYGFNKDNKSDFGMVGGLGSLVEDGPGKRALASAGQNFLNKAISGFTDPKKEGEDPKVVAALSTGATGENTNLTSGASDSIQNISDMVATADGGLSKAVTLDEEKTGEMANLGEEYKQGSLRVGENEKANVFGQSAASKENDIGQKDNYGYNPAINTAQFQKNMDPYAVGGVNAGGKSTDWAAILQTLAKIATA